MIRRSSALLLALALAGCVAVPPPAARKRAITAPPPPILLAPPRPDLSWLDLALTPGRWRYAATAGGTAATYAGFALRCEAGARQIVLARTDAPRTAALTVTTTYRAATLPAVGGATRLRAGDPLLDQLAFSRGRFMVEAAGAPRLILPAWAEPARVIEDCRAADPNVAS